MDRMSRFASFVGNVCSEQKIRAYCLLHQNYRSWVGILVNREEIYDIISKQLSSHSSWNAESLQFNYLASFHWV